VFKVYSDGVKTQRDEWMYDFDTRRLDDKVRYFIDIYERTRKGESIEAADIKWDRELDRYLKKRMPLSFSRQSIIRANYRPFVQMQLYFDRHLNGMVYLMPALFQNGAIQNPCITIMGDSTGKPYFALAIDRVPDLNFVSPASGGTKCFPRTRLADDGRRVDNITDWSLGQFNTQYEEGGAPTITKDAIFHYVYAVLHDPIYREKYALNLKREFPRIPFYPNFWKWADWGEKLMALHIGYETVEPWPLERIDAPDDRSRKAGLAPKAALKADKENGNIRLDSETQLTGVPPEAWTYRLGNRSALEWILDQYKEKTPKDPTIREKFNTYRFADHKEKVIDLLKRVTRVSVETMKIVDAMKAEKR